MSRRSVSRLKLTPPDPEGAGGHPRRRSRGRSAGRGGLPPKRWGKCRPLAEARHARRRSARASGGGRWHPFREPGARRFAATPRAIRKPADPEPEDDPEPRVQHLHEVPHHQASLRCFHLRAPINGLSVQVHAYPRSRCRGLGIPNLEAFGRVVDAERLVIQWRPASSMRFATTQVLARVSGASSPGHCLARESTTSCRPASPRWRIKRASSRPWAANL